MNRLTSFFKVSLGVLLLTSFVFAKVGLQDGPVKKTNNDALPIEKLGVQLDLQNNATAKAASPTAVVDTLQWAPFSDYNVNFVADAEDAYYTYLVPAAGGNLNKILIPISGIFPEYNPGLSVAVYSTDYPFDPAITPTQAYANDPAAWLGYYDEDTQEPFGDAANWVEGAFYDEFPDYQGTVLDPLGTKIWPSFGNATVSLGGVAGGDIVTINTADFGSAPTLTQGEKFVIFVSITGDVPPAADYSVGIYSIDGLGIEPAPGLKFYDEAGNPDGRLGNDDWGWYIRSYTWGVSAEVEYTTDRGPIISDVTDLLTTLSTDPRTVEATITDDNPSGGVAGVDAASLMYSVNGGDYMSVSMSITSGDVYAADIPGQSPGTSVSYYVMATDVNDNSSETLPLSYNIFEVSDGAQFLLLLDGLGDLGYPSEYYFYDAYGEGGMDFTYDLWAYGAVSADLLSNYDVVIEITTDGPSAGNATAVKSWLDGGGKKYILAGDEVLGAYYGWPGAPLNIDTVDAPHTDFFTYMGVDVYYGDINYAASGDNGLPWPMMAVDGDPISGAMFDSVAARGDTAQLMYDPAYEVNESNWLDGVTPEDGFNVAFTADPNPESDYTETGLATGIYREDTNLNNHTVFYGFEPLSLNGVPYHWYSATPYGPLTSALNWMGIEPTAIGDETPTTPDQYTLYSNYPNPFNPTTTIQYELPKATEITLNVYNSLGQKVTTLVSARQNAGMHSVEWNAADMASGVYFYQITAGDFNKTQKMVLLK